MSRAAQRPEERGGGNADVYYDRPTADLYTEQNVTTQRELTTRCLDMLCLEKGTGDGKSEVLLDIGCGSGLSGETLTSSGHRAWVGCDASWAMLERATRTTGGTDEIASSANTTPENLPSSVGAVARCDFSQGLPFRSNAFDGCVSVSAAQWLCASDNLAVSKRKLMRFFVNLRRVLKPGKRAALQVYPRTVLETFQFESAFTRCGLKGSPVTAFPHKTKAKKIFMCVERLQGDGDEYVRVDDALDWNEELTEKEKARRDKTPKPPRCPCAWPHAATCEAGWRRFVLGVDRVDATIDTTISPSLDTGIRVSTKERSDREHLSLQRRALRSLKRAQSFWKENNDASIKAWDYNSGDGTTDVTLTIDSETVVRDGTICACASVGLIVVAKVVTKQKEETEERKRKENLHVKSVLENHIALLALGTAKNLEEESVRSTNKLMYRLTYQEFVLETDFGDFGVCAVEVGEVGDALITSSSSSPAVAATTAVCAALSSAGREVLCAQTLLSDAEDRTGKCQVWCVWWPQREVGGKSSLENDGFEETQNLREKLASEFKGISETKKRISDAN